MNVMNEKRKAIVDKEEKEMNKMKDITFESPFDPKWEIELEQIAEIFKNNKEKREYLDLLVMYNKKYFTIHDMHHLVRYHMCPDLHNMVDLYFHLINYLIILILLICMIFIK